MVNEYRNFIELFDELKGISKNHLQEIGVILRDKIIQDTKAGKMQNGASGLSYVSGRYKNKKSKGIAAPNQISTNVSYVDMTLTGKLWENFKVVGGTGNFCWLEYGASDIDKIEVANRFNREIVGISKENQEMVTRMVENKLADIVEAICGVSDNLEIRIGN